MSSRMRWTGWHNPTYTSPGGEILVAVRRAMPELRIRLDANGAWTANEARVHLEMLSRIAPELVEEPACGDELLLLGRCAAPWRRDGGLDD